MALIVYPTANWDSFNSEADATTKITGFAASEGKTAYLALDEAGKEAILRQTALQIKLCPSIVLPDGIESDLALAQCYLTVHALSVDMMSYDANSNAITSEKVGSLAVSYNSHKKGSNSAFDTMTQALLKQYGCKSQKSGFSQSYIGRS